MKRRKNNEEHNFNTLNNFNQWIYLFSSILHKNLHLQESKSRWCIRSELTLIKIGMLMNTKSKMATSYCCNTTRHCQGIHSLFLSKDVLYDAYTHYRGIFHTQLTRFCRERESTFFSEPLKINDGCQGSCMTMFTFTIVSFIQWELYHLKRTMVLPDSWHLSMTHNNWITNCWTMLCLQSSSSPSHCCIWRVWSLWQVLLPWHEPNMVHVRLSFSQPGLCDVHSCSLLFVGALDELQHFIWSLE